MITNQEYEKQVVIHLVFPDSEIQFNSPEIFINILELEAVMSHQAARELVDKYRDTIVASCIRFGSFATYCASEILNAEGAD